MKKITTEIVCDVCGAKASDPLDGFENYDFGKEHNATVKFTFGYGSKYDTFHKEYHLCRIHAEELFEIMRQKYPKMITNESIEENSDINC